jgi:hypothetical protein
MASSLSHPQRSGSAARTEISYRDKALKRKGQQRLAEIKTHADQLTKDDPIKAGMESLRKYMTSTTKPVVRNPGQSAAAGTPSALRVPRVSRDEGRRTIMAATPKPTSSTPKKSAPKKVSSAGEASNRDLPGQTSYQFKGQPPNTTPPKRDVAALQAASKQSLADSKAAAAAHKNGPGGGAETVLQAYRGNKTHFPKREK